MKKKSIVKKKGERKDGESRISSNTMKQLLMNNEVLKVILNAIIHFNEFLPLDCKFYENFYLFYFTRDNFLY